MEGLWGAYGGPMGGSGYKWAEGRVKKSQVNGEGALKSFS